MKIVLIAGFSNPEIRGHLELTKDSWWYKWLIRLFRLPTRVGEFRDFAPWVPNIIGEIEKQDDMQLHVVCPHIRLKKSVETFKMRGVTYHFFRSEWTSLLRKLHNYRIWKHLQRTTHYVNEVVNLVQPDLIVLSGAENPLISVGILATDKYPRLCLCQTIYNNPERSQYSTPDKLNQDTEKDIFRQLKFFGVYSSMHYTLLKEFRPDATIFRFGYPSKGTLLEPSEIKKEFDFVNFALMHGSRKGTPDSIQALAIVKQKYPNVMLNIVGGCDPKGMERLKALVSELGLEQNVVYTPFFEKRSDLLLHVQKSRFAVLPCKLDHTAGTMSQAMQMELPMVVYRTTGTPSFNRDRECALIAEKGNVEELAQYMLLLMDNPQKGEMLRENARLFQEKKMEVARENGERLMEIFRAVIAKEQQDKEIPQELLFNPERDD